MLESTYVRFRIVEDVGEPRTLTAEDVAVGFEALGTMRSVEERYVAG